MRWGINMKNNKIIVMSILMATVLGLTGCGSADTSESAWAVNTTATLQDSYVESAYETAEAEGNQENGEIVFSDRKLIKTVNMHIETEHFKELTESLYTKVSTLGGYVENYRTEGEEGYRSSYMVVRIPQNQIDTFLETVEGQSNITYKQESVEDITLDYVDLESHKKMYQKEQERLLELLEQAETIEEIIRLEERLTEVQYQLESMESKLRLYDNKISYSTVCLNISEVERYTPQEQKNTWEQIKTGFSENVYRVVKGIKNFCVSFVIYIPIIVVWIIIIALFAIIVKYSIKIYDRRMEKKQNIHQLKQQNNNREENIKKNE